MAQHQIEYFYSTHSAYAYLGHQKLLEICARHDCRLIHRPFELSPVVEYAGGQPFAGRTQAHVDYFFGREIERWAAFRDVPIIDYRPTYHDNALTLSSGVLIAATARGVDLDVLSYAFLQGHWRDDINLADAEALADAMRGVGIAPEPLLEAAMSESAQAQLAANTQEAIARNMFGSPTYVLDGDMYYGQDHLELMEHALSKPFGAPAFRNPPVGGA